MAAKPTYEELEQRVKELEKKSLEQNSLERALRENEELLKETIESTADGILVVDKNEKISHVNNRFLQILSIFFSLYIFFPSIKVSMGVLP